MMYSMIWIAIFSLILVLQIAEGWRAVPANQAGYSLRAEDDEDVLYGLDITDEDLPRTELNNVYKFGWCTRDVVNHSYFRKSVNITFGDWKSTNVNYIYLIAKKHTQKYRHQCVVMKMYVPKKFLFYKSRLPMYYCQGTISYLMLNTINRYEIHEFYLGRRMMVPANFVFEFYHYKPY